MIKRDLLKINSKRWIAVFCAAMIAGSAAAINITASNATTNTGSTPSTAVEASAAKENKNISKDETVYVICNATGEKKQVIVSDHLKNMLDSATLTDKSSLLDIYNTNGEETFKKDTNDSITWNANGNDIYYRGTTDSALPVDIKITYTLDGKEISANELAGKSGHVTIKYSYTNKQSERVKVNGKDMNIYVPFLVASGMILDNDVFTNVEITNGKLVNDGSRIVAIGLALPGMNENLGLDQLSVTDKASFSIPDSFEISADVKNFSLGMSMSVATNELFNGIDTSALDFSDENGLIAELTDGITQIVEGSGSLYEGLDTLLEKTGELKAGVDALAAGSEALTNGLSDLSGGTTTLQNGVVSLKDGANALNSGAKDLKDGALQIKNGSTALSDGIDSAYAGSNTLVAGSRQLNDGLEQLSGGLSEISASSETLNAGALQVFNTLLDAANTQLAAAGLKTPKLTVDNYAAVIDQAIKSLDSKTVYNVALGEVTKKVDAMGDKIYVAYVEQNAQAIYLQYAGGNANVASSLTKEQKEQIKAGAMASLTKEQKAAIRQGAIDQAMTSDEVKAQLAKASEGVKSLTTLKASLDSYKQFYNGVITYTGAVDSASLGASQVYSGSSELYKGTQSLSDGLSTLSDGANTLEAGSATLYAGTDALASGTKELSAGVNTLDGGVNTMADGANKLYAGSKALNEGIKTLQASMPELIEGVTALRDGSKTLYDGLTSIYTEGVQGLVNVYEGDITELTERIKATIELSKNYKSFTGVDDNMDGTVRFIYRTEEITATSEK